MSILNNLVVYCGSSDGQNPCYLKSAEDLGNELLKKGIGLVYGGGTSGLMGKVAKTVHDGGGRVTGIITEHLNESETASYGETIVVKTMHERKKMMFEKVGGFIALPGGFGTMEELVEIITWYQLNLHKKPIGVLNVNHYYDKFFEWIQHSVKEGFISASSQLPFVMHSEPVELIKLMEMGQK